MPTIEWGSVWQAMLLIVFVAAVIALMLTAKGRDALGRLALKFLSGLVGSRTGATTSQRKRKTKTSAGGADDAGNPG